MAPSQLKQLKQSLRDSGIIGPTRSKKNGKSNRNNPNQRDELHKAAALADIREKARPFDVQMASRPQKFAVTTAKTMRDDGKNRPTVLGRPGVSRSKGEELRRNTLLVDLQSRGKIGGILDRRIGENNSQMSHEERLHHRLIKEASTKRRGGKALFDLENAENEFALTHDGQEIDFDGLDVGMPDEEEEVDNLRKRPFDQSDDNNEDDEDDTKPERKKSKADVMREVMAKSKYHRAERQMAHEDDLLLVAELDKQAGDIMRQLSGIKPQAPVPISARATVTIPPPRSAVTGPNAMPLGGVAAPAPVSAPVLTQQQKDKSYDVAVKELATDAKARPTFRTKTEDEISSEYADKMKKLEEDRLRRMNGEIVPTSQDADMMDLADDEARSDDGDAAEFGFDSTKLGRGLDEEDDFLIDEDLVGSDDDDQDDDDDDYEDDSDLDEGDDPSFTAQFKDDTLDTYFPPSEMENLDDSAAIPCPVTHAELVHLLEGSDVAHLPKTIQQIRAIYGGTLPERREKLGKFAGVLVEHLHYLGSQKPAPSPIVIDQIIRHLQSLSRTFALSISVACRSQLDEILKTTEDGEMATILTPGHLIVLTAIGTIFSTSDQFHPVGLPAMTIMTRWLSLHSPLKNRQDSAIGCYLVQLVLKYQAKSKRYVPECLNFTLSAIEQSTTEDNSSSDLVDQFTANVLKMAELWSDKPSFIEMFSPRALDVLEARVKHLSKLINQEKVTKPKSKKALAPITPSTSSSAHTVSLSTTRSAIQKLRIQLSQTNLSRRTLELHHHRPRPIRTYIPRFEDNFDPDKHYDTNQDRAELAKLRAEHKREHKGAIRDLRKDSNFIARQQLQAKKVTDTAYHDKMRRLVAEVQGAEGKEKNAYDRERKMRKQKK